MALKIRENFEDYTRFELTPPLKKALNTLLKLEGYFAGYKCSYNIDSILQGFRFRLTIDDRDEISVVFHRGSYGNEDGLFEIALIRNKKVLEPIGYQTESQVVNLLLKAVEGDFTAFEKQEAGNYDG